MTVSQIRAETLRFVGSANEVLVDEPSPGVVRVQVEVASASVARTVKDQLPDYLRREVIPVGVLLDVSVHYREEDIDVTISPSGFTVSAEEREQASFLEKLQERVRAVFGGGNGEDGQRRDDALGSKDDGNR